MRKIFLCFWILAFSLVAVSQQVTDITKVPSINKGKIVMTDGTTENFRNLSVSGNTVKFTNQQNVATEYPGNNVYKITKTGSYAAVGAITTALGGLAGAYLGTREWENYDELRGKESSYIIACTIGGAIIGGITGALIKRDKIIYKNPSPLSFYPEFNILQNNKACILLTWKISLNSKIN